MPCAHPKQRWPSSSPRGPGKALPCAQCETTQQLLHIPIDDMEGGIGLLTLERIALGGRWVWRLPPSVAR